MATHDTHTHHDVSHDKGPAFVGLFGGLIVVGLLTYGMVLWTNAQFAGHAAEGAAGKPAAAAATH
jgi:hypothetical protein